MCAISRINPDGPHQNTADRLTDRISVVGASGVGEGVRFELPLVSTSIVGADRIEIWTIQADLTDRDRADVTVDGEVLLVRTDNGTATHVRAISENGTVVHDLQPEPGGAASHRITPSQDL